MTEANISNFSGWLAIAYLIIKDILIPLFRKAVPAKMKKDQAQQTHEFVVEQKRLDAELATQKSLRESIEKLTDAQVKQAETQAKQAEISRVQTDTLIRLEDGQKEILNRLPKPRKSGAK